MVVGGWAVAFHGRPRYTKDIDLLIGVSSDNAVNLLKALAAFGFGAVDVTEEDLQQPNLVIQ
jgi:hypothetical protein